MLQHRPTPKKSKAGPSEPPETHLRVRTRSPAGPSHSPVPSAPTTPTIIPRAPVPLSTPKIAHLRDLYENAKTVPSESPTPTAPTTPRTPLRTQANFGNQSTPNKSVPRKRSDSPKPSASTTPRTPVRSNTGNFSNHRDLNKSRNRKRSESPKPLAPTTPRMPVRSNTGGIGTNPVLNKSRSRRRSESPKTPRSQGRNPANTGNIRDLNKATEKRRSESPQNSRPTTPRLQPCNAANTGKPRDQKKKTCKTGRCTSPSPAVPSTHVLNGSASPTILKKADRDSLKRKLEIIDDELRKKNKVVHGKDGKEMVDRAVTEVESEEEDSKLIELGAETSSRALMRESVKAVQEAKDRGLYDEYTSPDRVVRVPRSSWLMKPKPKKKKAQEKKPLSPDKDDGTLKRTLSELILLKPKKKSDEKDHEEQESLRRTLSEAVKCRVQDRRKRTELTANVKANLEEGFKDRRLDELTAQVAAYAEKMGVQIRKSEVQDELYEIQKAKISSQSQEICKLKSRLDSAKRTTEAVKLEQVRLTKVVEDTKEEVEALKTLVGRMFVESSMKNI